MKLKLTLTILTVLFLAGCMSSPPPLITDTPANNFNKYVLTLKKNDAMKQSQNVVDKLSSPLDDIKTITELRNRTLFRNMTSKDVKKNSYDSLSYNITFTEKKINESEFTITKKTCDYLHNYPRKNCDSTENAFFDENRGLKPDFRMTKVNGALDIKDLSLGIKIDKHQVIQGRNSFDKSIVDFDSYELDYRGYEIKRDLTRNFTFKTSYSSKFNIESTITQIKRNLAGKAKGLYINESEITFYPKSSKSNIEKVIVNVVPYQNGSLAVVSFLTQPSVQEKDNVTYITYNDNVEDIIQLAESIGKI